MKLLTSLAVLYLIYISVEGHDEEKFVRIVIPPTERHFDSDGNYGAAIAPNKHHRMIREKKTCMIPNSMDDSQLECNMYPSKVACTQTCMFGHTLSEGIQREMKCKNDEDRWTPSNEFEKCKPFVDCTLTIGSGGSYKCYTNYMDKGPICDVSCQHYEDKAEVPTQSYQCDIHGKWTPKLPFCAKAGSGVKLVSPPKGTKLKTYEEL